MVRKRNSKEIYAMKILDKSIIAMRKQEIHTKSERSILANIKSPFIVELFYAFQTRTKLFLVMEFVNGGELNLHLKRSRRFSEEKAAFYAAEISCALHDLHSNGIIYRDLKPENVLIGSDGHIKLTDFGLSKEFRTNEETRSYTIVGTADYLAPEMLQGGGHDKSVDWWSLVNLLKLNEK